MEPASIKHLGAGFAEILQGCFSSILQRVWTHQSPDKLHYQPFHQKWHKEGFESLGELTVEPGYDPSKKTEIWRYASVCLAEEAEKDDCDFDRGGYFIVKAEKTFIAQKQICRKRLWISSHPFLTVAFQSEVKRNRLIIRLAPSQVEDAKPEKVLTVYFLSTEIPVWILFFALGVSSDREVVDLIDFATGDASISNILFASISTADKACDGFRKSQAALTHVDKQLKKTLFPPKESIEECLSMYMFPNLRSTQQKARFLGYMVKCLLQAATGRRKLNNKDDFRNKRLDLAVTNGLSRAFSTGAWCHPFKRTERISGVVANVGRTNPLQTIVDMRKTRQQVQYTGKVGDARYPILRPLLVVENLGKLTQSKAGKYTFFRSLLDRGIVEFIGAEEEEDCRTAWGIKFLFMEDKGKPVEYTHCELDMSFLLSVSCGIIPFANHDHARRVLYQAQKHSQQAIGFSTTNPNIRVDTLSHQLHYPQRPLFRTIISDCLGKPGYPKNECYNGQNAIVAVNVHLGYNQEDSLVMNRASLRRTEKGWFRRSYSPLMMLKKLCCGLSQTGLHFLETNFEHARTEGCFGLLESQENFLYDSRNSSRRCHQSTCISIMTNSRSTSGGCFRKRDCFSKGDPSETCHPFLHSLG
uniref:DNA-directed RNA polymerase n=1 Tax=Cannabis sativa TaxID=3483 RepID=A0A803Q9E8_CANSA